MMLRGEKKRSKDVYLEEPIGTDKEGNTISFMDVIEHDEMDILSRMELEEDTVRVRAYVDTHLTDREREILVLRYGLNGHKSVTQSEIGNALGISRSYVSRIEKRALQKLRERFHLDTLRPV